MEGFYRDLIHSLPDIVYQIDIEGRFVYINDSVEKLGYHPEELLGKHFDVIISPEYHRKVNRLLFITGQSDEPLKKGVHQFINERRTGKRITKHLEVQLAPNLKNGQDEDRFWNGEVFATGLYTNSGNEKKFIGTIGVIREILNEKVNSKTLLRMENYYRLMLENSSEIIAVVAHDGTILFISKSVEVNLGINYIDLIGENVEDIIHENDRLLFEKFKDNKVGGNRPRMEVRLQHANGSWRYFETSITKITDSNDYVVCRVFHCTDITKRKEIEKALIRRKRIYKTLLRTSPDAILLFDKEGDVIMANDRASEIASISREDMIGMNYLDFIAEKNKDTGRKIQKDLAVTGMVYDNHYIFIDSNGNTFPIEASFSAIKDDDGNLEGYLSVFRDITLRKNNEKEKEKLEDELLQIIFGRLSDREIELIQYLARGYAWPQQKREIGKLMDALPGTLDQFIARIKKKTKMEDLEKISYLAALRFKWKV